MCTKSWQWQQHGSMPWLELFIFGFLGRVGLGPWEEGKQWVHVSALQCKPSRGLGAVMRLMIFFPVGPLNHGIPCCRKGQGSSVSRQVEALPATGQMKVGITSFRCWITY